jgi:hypothetical protein
MTPAAVAANNGDAKAQSNDGAGGSLLRPVLGMRRKATAIRE